jgi:hypothetical protein
LKLVLFAILLQKLMKGRAPARIGFAKTMLEAISRATFEIATSVDVGATPGEYHGTKLDTR